MRRGEIWWANLPAPVGSGPGFRRPALIVQADEVTESRIRTIVIVTLTSNLQLEAAPGNVLVRPVDSGLQRDSVVNVSQILTVDQGVLTEQVGELDETIMDEVDEGLRLILSL